MRWHRHKFVLARFQAFPAFSFAEVYLYVDPMSALMTHLFHFFMIPNPGLDIGYVPPGPHAFLRLSGQFGPPQFIFVVFFFFLVLRMPPLFLLGIGKTRKATLIRTYFLLYIGLMYKSVQLHA